MRAGAHPLGREEWGCGRRRAADDVCPADDRLGLCGVGAREARTARAGACARQVAEEGSEAIVELAHDDGDTLDEGVGLQ